MKFETEEKRIEAMNALDTNDPNNEAKLNEIISAEIGVEEIPPEGDKPPESVPPDGEKSPEGDKPPEGGGKPPESTPQKYEITDLKGHKSPEELLKSWDNKEEMIQRQGEKIKQLMEAQVDPELKQRLETAERELAELKKAGGSKQQVQGSTADLKTLKDTRNRINSELMSLSKKVEEDEEYFFTKEYQTKLLKLQQESILNTAAYDTALEKVSSDLADTRRSHTEFVDNQIKRSKESDEERQFDAIFEQLDALEDPEYKTVTPTKQLMHKYLKWRDDVSFAYYGRMPKNEQEAYAAMKQLELGNPQLIQQCGLLGTPVKPDEEMKKYVLKTELNLYRQGYRKNPVTGKFDSDNRLKDGNGNPIVFPDIKTALAAMRDESGYYQKKEQNAYQQGASDLALSMERRDQGAVTLDGKDQRKTEKDEAWAQEYLGSIDENAIRDAIDKGETEKLTEYYQAMKMLGIPVT